MTLLNEAQLRKVVTSALEIPEGDYQDTLALGDCPMWDSLGHMNLICSIESAFAVRFESTEIPELKSVAKIKEALTRKV